MKKLKNPDNIVPLIDYKNTAILDALNSANKNTGETLVTADQISVSKPKAADATWIAEKDNGNTILHIVALANKGLSGSRLVTYDRVELDMLCTLFSKQLYIPRTVTNIYDTLPWILKRFGIKIYESDVEDGPINWVDTPAVEHIPAADGKPEVAAVEAKSEGSFTLKAIGDSYIFTGESEIKTLPCPPALDYLIENEGLNNFKQEKFLCTDKLILDTLTYGIDASSSYDDLINITPQNYNYDKFISYLSTCDWTSPALLKLLGWSPKKDKVEGEEKPVTLAAEAGNLGLDIHDFVVSYNGVNSGIAHTRNDFKYVLILSPKDDSKYLGNLYFHYNNNKDDLSGDK